MILEQTISEPQRAILKSTKAMNLFLGGVGSGKTYMLGIKTYQLIRNFPRMRGFIGANTAMQLTQSTLFRIREYWKSIGIVEYDKAGCPHGQYVINKQPPSHFNIEGHSFDSYYNIISFINGCVVFVGSLENSAAHSGKEMAWAVLDETWDTREEDVKEIILARIRQRGIYLVNGELKDTGTPEQQYNPLYIATSPAKVEWLNQLFELDNYVDEISRLIYSDKTFFFKEFNNKCAVVSSTYHNIHNVGEAYIKNILNNNSQARGSALIYACPFATTGGEFYSSFDRLEHVGTVKYQPDLPIHISFDQNSVPYNSASIWQIVRKDDYWELRAIDEIALVNPRNSTEEVCEEFILRYANHKAGIFYYGDASGHNRSTMNKDFKHHYEIVQFKLAKYLVNTSDRTLFVNPSLVLRRDFVNRIFENKLPIRVVIDESCHHIINDYMYVKQALDGTKDKHIVTDKETGEKYQKYGHLSDSCFVYETKVITDKGEKCIGEITPEDNVLTRNGFRRVINVLNQGNKKIKKYQIGEKSIECTPDHKIFANGEFVLVSSLINKIIFTIFEEKTSWIDKLLIMMGINSIDTHAQKDYQTGDITKDGLKKKESGERQVFMFTYLKRLMGEFQRVLQFIILTVIAKIIDWRIYILYRNQNIRNIIIKSVHKNLKTAEHWCYTLRHALKLNYGMAPFKVESGTELMLKKVFMEWNRRQYVLSVIKNLKQSLKISLNFVPQNAKTGMSCEDIERIKDSMKIESVKDVEKYFRYINGVKLFTVPVVVRTRTGNKTIEVYDITVEQEHEFFANGILVHNCDYLMVELFKDYYNG